MKTIASPTQRKESKLRFSKTGHIDKHDLTIHWSDLCFLSWIKQISYICLLDKNIGKLQIPHHHSFLC